MRKTDLDEQILRASKEIVVKFIETGRISPTGFSEVFKAITERWIRPSNRLPPVRTRKTATGSEPYLRAGGLRR